MTNFNRSDFSFFINIKSSSKSLYDDITNSSQVASLANGKITNISERLQLVERLTIHITLIVSIIGLIGNGCTIIVLNRQSMRKWRSSILLSSLAVADFLYLLIIFLSIIDELINQIIGLNRSLTLCQVTVYITHVCSFLSANFTLSFTLQRCVAVTFPLHADTIISNRSSIINILVLLLFGCSFYSFSFFLTNISHGQCREDETYPALFPLLIVDTCLTFVVPFIFILIFNGAILYKLQQRKKFSSVFDGSLIRTSHRRTPSPTTIRGVDGHVAQEQLHSQKIITLENGNNPLNIPILSARKLSAQFSGSSTKLNRYSSRFLNPRSSVTTILNEYVSTPLNFNNRQAISQRTTKMLVICSTTFLLFNSPYCAVLLYSIISKVVLTRTLRILRHFYFMSFCLNFFLYSLWGNRFREEFILLVKGCCSGNIHLPCSNADKMENKSRFCRVNTTTAV
ncbi:unnamed protein product [Rotaria socialis]|uniref:G-protein coupled receptors family 1 profile domain-containing protein n=1 Tax=Rotaria socialis TaxID=392032 RepID=A0A818E9C3_9BILA|nr:unnamed protein product [Rotaria socialis]